MRTIIAVLLTFLPSLLDAQSNDSLVPDALEAAVAAEALHPVGGSFAIFIEEGVGTRLGGIPAGFVVSTRAQALRFERGRPIGFSPGYGGYLVIESVTVQADGAVVVYMERREPGAYRSLGGADIRTTVVRDSDGWRVVQREVRREI